MSWQRVMLVFVAAAVVACKPIPETAPEPSAMRDVGAAAVQDDRGAADPTKPEFDPKVACRDLALASIPSVPVLATLPRKRTGDLQQVSAELAWGRVELRESNVALRLAGEELSECSPFTKDGSIPTAPRITIAIAGNRQEPAKDQADDAAGKKPQAGPGLEPGTWRFPDLEKRDFQYWNHVTVDGAGQPYTVNAIETDSGLLVIDQIDRDRKEVVGRLLLCLDRGKQGWAAGTFKLPLCEKAR